MRKIITLDDNGNVRVEYENKGYITSNKVTDYLLYEILRLLKDKS